jgi:hypothetical protein
MRPTYTSRWSHVMCALPHSEIQINSSSALDQKQLTLCMMLRCSVNVASTQRFASHIVYIYIHILTHVVTHVAGARVDIFDHYEITVS